MACALSTARILLIVFNFIFWLSGVAILGVGIWFLADPRLQDYIDVIQVSGDQHFKTASYILIAFGAFIFLVGFCGCCGAIRKSKCLLGFYILFLVFVFAGELTAGILAAVYRDEIIKKFDQELSNSIKNDYQTNLSWDVVQKELKCCGGVNITDYNDSKWRDQNPGLKIPRSCCTDDSSEETSRCQTMISNYYTEPCKDKLVEWVYQHGIILIGVGCGIACLQIFGLVFAICLCRSVDGEKY